MTKEDQFKEEENTIVLRDDFKVALKEAFGQGQKLGHAKASLKSGHGLSFNKWFNRTYKYSGEDKEITF